MVAVGAACWTRACDCEACFVAHVPGSPLQPCPTHPPRVQTWVLNLYRAMRWNKFYP